MTPSQREAMHIAIGALVTRDADVREVAITALRDALAAPVEPVGEHDSLRDNIGQAISDVLTGWYGTEDGALGVDPFDSRNIDEIADAVIRVLPAAPTAPAAQALTDAARDVLAERHRQVSVEGWTPEHDDAHRDCQLAAAAATYAMCEQPEQLRVCGVVAWPWPLHWWKPTNYRRNLVKAGALVLAEIERLDRANGISQGGE